MNTQLIRWVAGASLALGIAWSLMAWSIPTRAAPTAALLTSATAATSALAATTATTFTVNSAVDAVHPGACSQNTPQQCTLREAILEANGTAGATIVLPGLAAGQVYALTIPASGPDDGTSGDLNVNASMNIIGEPTISDPGVIVDAHLANDRVFNIASGVTVSIANLTVQHGAPVEAGAGQYGGGIYNGGTLTLSDSTVFSNTAFYGAGIVNHGTLTLIGSTVSSNTAGYGIGGGIYNDSTLILSNSTVSGNSATTGAGIFSNSAATMTLSKSTVSGNTALAYSTGGGIENSGTLTLTDSIIVSNTAVYGAGIVNRGTLTLIGSTVSGNRTLYGSGGGIWNGGPWLMLVNSTVANNTGGVGGGGILSGGALTLIGSTVISNTAFDGGGIFSISALMLVNSTVSGNTARRDAGRGGGLYNNGSLLATNSTLSGNTAATGGGLFSDHAGALTYSTLNGNSATTGGGIYQSAKFVTQTLSLSSTMIANSPSGGNCASDAAGFPLSSNGYNLSSDGTCAPYFTQAGDLNNTNPNLGPLANNGGPTLTHMPLPPSPAIDAIPLGINGCGTTLTTDQRGVARPINGKCDIGAVEYVVLAPSLWLPLIVR